MTHHNEFISAEEKHHSAVAEYFSTKTEFWDVVYEKEHPASGRSLIQQESMMHRRETALEYISKYCQKGNAILDVGCGTGTLALELARRGYEVSAVDIAGGMINHLLQKIKKENLNIKCLKSPAEEMPFDNECFDSITCLGVIEYVPVPEIALFEMNRVIKKNGYLIISMPNLLKLNNLLDPVRLIKRGYKYILKSKEKELNSLNDLSTNENFLNKRFRLNKFIEMAEECNFKLIEHECIGYGPFTFNERNLFSDSISLKLHYKLSSLAKNYPFNFLKHFCNRWVLCLQKTA
ncbi:MAG TPA: methyltransferase domain-containing protein [Ignavibacteriaceae bacterium]|nr:methyltransferase domain-containing protein [Ignavibacteriaceae bacterium]